MESRKKTWNVLELNIEGIKCVIVGVNHLVLTNLATMAISVSSQSGASSPPQNRNFILVTTNEWGRLYVERQLRSRTKLCLVMMAESKSKSTQTLNNINYVVNGLSFSIIQNEKKVYNERDPLLLFLTFLLGWYVLFIGSLIFNNFGSYRKYIYISTEDFIMF